MYLLLRTVGTSRIADTAEPPSACDARRFRSSPMSALVCRANGQRRRRLGSDPGLDVRSRTHDSGVLGGALEGQPVPVAEFRLGDQGDHRAVSGPATGIAVTP